MALVIIPEPECPAGGDVCALTASEAVASRNAVAILTWGGGSVMMRQRHASLAILS